MFSDGVMYTNIVDNYTVSGHVVGMLDRDQRTAKLRCDSYQQSAMFSVLLHTQNNQYYYVQTRQTKPEHELISHPYLLKRKNSHSSRIRRNIYFWNTLRRLKHVLIFGIYLFGSFNLPCIFSAPTNFHHMADRIESHPKWINPCGIDTDNGAIHDMNTQIPKLPDSDLLMQIVSQARIALTKAEQFKEDFAQKLYNTNSKQVHENWKGTEYEWLPQRKDLHKGLNETVPEEHLLSLKMDDTLLNTYHYLQMLAVGLEQVVWDQEDDDGPFLQGFNQSEYNLRLVLCEIQMAIYERGIYGQMKPDVTRESMPDYLRVRDENNSTARNLRDWIIYRDYMNALEYVVQVFEYLKEKL